MFNEGEKAHDIYRNLVYVKAGISGEWERILYLINYVGTIGYHSSGRK